MKKFAKFILKFLLWIIGLALVIVLTLPFWISPVGRIAANIAVPKITGEAFRLERLNLGMDWFSLATDTIVVKDVTIGGLYCEHNMSLPTFSLGGDKKGEAKKEAPKPQTTTAKAEKKEGPSKKVIIDHLLIEDVKVVLNGVPIPVPRIELTGIGRKSNGVTMAEAWDEISEQVLSSASKIGKVGVEQAKKVMDGANKAVEGANKTLDSATKSVGTVTKGVSETAGKSVEGVNKAATKTMESVNKGLNKATDKAADAVNAIKGLF